VASKKRATTKKSTAVKKTICAQKGDFGFSGISDHIPPSRARYGGRRGRTHGRTHPLGEVKKIKVKEKKEKAPP